MKSDADVVAGESLIMLLFAPLPRKPALTTLTKSPPTGGVVDILKIISPTMVIESAADVDEDLSLPSRTVPFSAIAKVEGTE